MSESAGLHIIMDAYVADAAVFTKEKLTELFAKLISALDMKALDKSVFYEVPVDPEVLERIKRTGTFEDSGGITGFQVISTSHMSLHAWPLDHFFSLDTFSCKDFNAELAIGVIKETLGVTEASVKIIQRRKPSRRRSSVTRLKRSLQPCTEAVA
jgi:S-adenosylmethionine/arginine decarboxylase-like enzyme